MNKVLIFLMACVILAILKVALVALMVALALTLLFFLVTRPGETIAALGVAALFGLASAQPTVFIITLGVLGVVVVLVGAWRKSRSRTLMIDTRTKPQRQLFLTDGRGDRST